FVLVILLYTYIGLSGLIIRSLTAPDILALYLALIYFIASAIGIILLLVRINRKLKSYDRV
ncbi:MAG TPA: DUF2157 domain-containing protein, partial [Puia sp.]